MEQYKRSLEQLKLYLKVVKSIPSETEWNRYATIEKFSSSKALEYWYGKKFNKMCRELIKNVNKERRAKE